MSIPNVIDYVESNRPGLLFPIQRVILKAYYGIPLDDIAYFPVRTGPRARSPLLYCTEQMYLEYLFDQGRCNIDKVIPDDERRELVLVAGRRLGKSFMLQCIAAYEMHKLLLKEDPQAYYRMPESSIIQITGIAFNLDGAGMLANNVMHTLRDRGGRGFEQGSTSKDTHWMDKGEGRFSTYADLAKGTRPSVRLKMASPLSKALRGINSLVVVFDESAHYGNAEEVYKAVTPSTRNFRNDGKVITASGPNSGDKWLPTLFYKGFQAANRNHMLCFQIPTWDNPTLPGTELEKIRQRESSDAFASEFGARFN